MHELVRQAGLSPRERRTLRCLLTGCTEAHAARQLGLGLHTVHEHVRRIYRKFGVRSRPQLMAKFLADIDV